MKIEVGGVYRSRCGERVEIVSDEGDQPYPFTGDDGDTYSPSGVYLFGLSSVDHDLIAPWTDENTYLTILEAIVGPDVCAMARKIEEALSK